MKQFYKLLLIFLTLLVLQPYHSFCQFVVTKVIDKNINTSQEGFFYTLPQTVLKIDLALEKVQQVPGPLAEYTENYLGTSDYIRSNNTTYQVLHVNLEPRFEPDPNQIYYVQFPAERSKDETGTAFSLSTIGSLLAYNDDYIPKSPKTKTIDQTLIFMEGDEGFPYQADYHRKKKTDTITRKITIDTVSIERFIFKTSWVDKNNEDKANEAALQISNIREARFNLLTGYQEVNYGESMKYMDYQLLQLEKKYLELFLGKESKSYVNQSVYYTPKKDEVRGLILELDGNSNVEIKIVPGGNTSLLPDNPLAKINYLYYRIPDIAIVEIIQNNKVVFREKLFVNQLGVTAAAPLDKVKSQFNPETGGLIKITRE